METNSPAIVTEQIWRHEHEAIKALYDGTADPAQQRLALVTIIRKLAREGDLAYVPGSFDGSAFLAGRMFVGQRIRKLLSSNVSATPIIPTEENRNE